MPRTTPAPASFSRFRLDFAPMAARRRFLGMSQRQLAAAIGVHPITICRTERGRSEPTYSQMLAASRALGTPIYELVNVVEPGEPGAA